MVGPRDPEYDILGTCASILKVSSFPTRQLRGSIPSTFTACGLSARCPTLKTGCYHTVSKDSLPGGWPTFRGGLPTRLTTRPCPAAQAWCPWNFEEQLMISRRGTENLPRDIAIYLVRHHCRDTLAGIGSYFGIDNYSTVSSAIERIKARKRTDRSLKKDLKELERKLDKSQRQTPFFWDCH